MYAFLSSTLSYCPIMYSLSNPYKKHLNGTLVSKFVLQFFITVHKFSNYFVRYIIMYGYKNILYAKKNYSTGEKTFVRLKNVMYAILATVHLYFLLPMLHANVIMERVLYVYTGHVLSEKNSSRKRLKLLN